jgi:Cof subfamily protein (haloacid dehalogenase superfamily)
MFKQPYKLLVVDIDGTLMNSRGVISAEDKEALTRVRRMGITVAISTGRAMQATKWVLEQLGIDGFHMFYDGSLVSNPWTGQVIYAETIARDVVLAAVSFARRTGLHIDVYSPAHYYAEKEDWATEVRRKFFKMEPVLTDLYEISRKERIIKATVIVRTDPERAKAMDFEKEFRDRLLFSWTTTPAYPELDFINLVSPRVSKGRALEELANYLKIPLSQVVAIGDGINDVSLLKVAGLAVAMGNCVEELKSVAHSVTHDVDHSGVAEAVKRYIG